MDRCGAPFRAEDPARPVVAGADDFSSAAEPITRGGIRRPVASSPPACVGQGQRATPAREKPEFPTVRTAHCAPEEAECGQAHAALGESFRRRRVVECAGRKVPAPRVCLARGPCVSASCEGARFSLPSGEMSRSRVGRRSPIAVPKNRAERSCNKKTESPTVRSVLPALEGCVSQVLHPGMKWRTA
jgi:hypothetical protein